MNIKAKISYIGTRYFGWQKTASGPSIQAAVEEGLEQILQKKIPVEAASRTDRGVHAKGQIIQFVIPDGVDLGSLTRSLQGVLPKDISVQELEYVSSHFHPTLDCIAKEYHYEICSSPVQSPFWRSLSWHYPFHPLHLKSMEQAAELLCGSHDFAALTNRSKEPNKSSERQIFVCKVLQTAPSHLQIVVKGNAFLYKMVRNLAGLLVYVGAGKIPLSTMPDILRSKDRRRAGMTAPAHGLCLNEVFY